MNNREGVEQKSGDVVFNTGADDLNGALGFTHETYETAMNKYVKPLHDIRKVNVAEAMENVWVASDIDMPMKIMLIYSIGRVMQIRSMGGFEMMGMMRDIQDKMKGDLDD